MAPASAQRSVLLLLPAVAAAAAAAALGQPVGGRRLGACAGRARAPAMQTGGFPDGSGDDMLPPESERADSDEEASEVADFRAQLLRQMLGGDATDATEPNAVDQLLGAERGVARACLLYTSPSPRD